MSDLTPVPTPTPLPPTHVSWRRKMLLCLVGLPARGKSYISVKLVAWLRWRGYEAELFNVGKFRRQQVTMSQSADFFDANNENAKQQRDEVAFGVLRSALEWLSTTGDVAVFDATNSTRARRREVLNRTYAFAPALSVVFIESLCNDERVLTTNYIAKAQHSPDYKHLPLEEALVDLRKRIANYEKVYEPIDEDVSYIKLINLASKVVCNKIHGPLAHAIAGFLMSIHIQPRPIYLVRAGHCPPRDSQKEIDSEESDSNNSSDEQKTSAQTPPQKLSQALPHLALRVSMAAHLDEKGQWFSQQLCHFIQQKCLQYWHSHIYRNNETNQQGTNTDSNGDNSAKASLQNGHPAFPPDVQIIPVNNSSSSSESNSPTSKESTGGIIIGSGTMRLTLHRSNSENVIPLIVYTSTLPRSIDTIQPLRDRVLHVQQQSSLNIVDMGVCDGMTVEALAKDMPDVLQRWSEQKFNYRWPGGESQSDKARSLESLVMELERQLFPVLVVSHSSTLQILYGYFLGPSCHVSEYSELVIPQHTLIELKPTQYGYEEKRYKFDYEAYIKKQRELEEKAQRGEAVTEADKEYSPIEMGPPERAPRSKKDFYSSE